MKNTPNDMLEKKFIDWAEKQVAGSVTVVKETHGDQSSVFKLQTLNRNYFLKIATGLQKERERLEWLSGKVPVPQVIGFTSIDTHNALLLSAIEGVNLAVLGKIWPAEKIVTMLAEALHQFHQINTKNCPFGIFNAGDVLVHGDACLPNFIFHDDIFSGYIDVGDVAVGNPEIDFSAAIWSLQYNLGFGYGKLFLEKYGAKNVTEKLVETLRLRYEDMQSEWGLSVD